MSNLPVYNSKLEALTEIFEIEAIASNWPKSKIKQDSYLGVISRPAYNLSRDLKVSDETISKLHKMILPDKPKTSGKVCQYLLNKYGLRCCASCNKVFYLEDFHTNSSKTYGKDSYCKICFNNNVREYRRNYTAFHKAEKLNRIPSWANMEKIRQIYDLCPEGMHVDHIIPLLGELVSGLHVEYNLQYLTAEENIKKSNKFIPG